MKKNLLFTLFLFLLFIACSKKEHVPGREPIEQTEQQGNYEFETIRFFLSPGDESPDTVRMQLDTIYIINNSPIRQPDAQIHPYDFVKDSFGLQLDSGYPAILKDAVFPDSISIPYIVDHGRLYYNGDKEINVAAIPGHITYGSYFASRELKLSITPKTRYKVTGTYHVIKYGAGFEATFRSKRSGKTLKAEGRWFSTVATTHPFNGSKSFMVFADPI